MAVGFQGPSGGSPPLARGRRYESRRSCIAVGLTPACAGKTNISASSASASMAHPRLRGEDSSVKSEETMFSGSPPLARGRPELRAARWSHRRLTPACAGKTLDHVRPCPYLQAHPRLRGEDLSGILILICDVGSPPLARGRRNFIRFILPVKRLTPACAGKTYQMGGRRAYTKAHPRLRGEDYPGITTICFDEGSPPLARGRLSSVHLLCETLGLTPACAGKTLKIVRCR